MGKLSNEELTKLLSCVKKDSRVIIPPKVGYDSGVHVVEGKYLVVATDPCTNVPEEWFGWLLINYAASDVALSGAKPEFCTINLLGPKPTRPELFQKVMKQTCTAADELNIAIVRGHTGTYDCILGLVGVATVYGSIQLEKLITPANAKPGDLILCTKPLGLETMINFSIMQKSLATKLFGTDKQEAFASQIYMQTCVTEALQLAKTGLVHAMHDSTEGGFVSALNELADASHVGFRVDLGKIPISNEALKLQAYFKLTDEQLLALSSTGTILAAVGVRTKEKVKSVLSENRLASYFIGEFTENKKRILISKGKQTAFPSIANDPYSQILSGK